jgi:energy-coupling factor transporter ATP-binding protein EcfA2
MALTRGSAVIASHLTFDYPDGNRGLSDVELRLDYGDKVGLIGPSGAGKSTLLQLVAAVGRGRTEGTLEVTGIPVSRRTAKKIRSRVGIVFQETEDQLFMPTLGEDVAFGPKAQGLKGEALAQRVDDALRRVGLAGFQQRDARRLSGGEKRRAALATVLAMDVDILALDEPTSNLDPRNARLITDLLASLPETVLLATHDLELVSRVCSRCVVLDDGQTVAAGPVSTLLADESLLETHGLR